MPVKVALPATARMPVTAMASALVLVPTGPVEMDDPRVPAVRATVGVPDDATILTPLVVVMVGRSGGG